MGLRCLLGHDFTEPRTERDREERGEEVVISEREVKECRRCGDTRVVSENKEVTSVDQLLEESGAGSAPRPGPTDDGRSGPDAATGVRGDDAAFVDADDADAAPASDVAAGSAPTDAGAAGPGTAGVADAGVEGAGVADASDAPESDDAAVITDAESGESLEGDEEFDHPAADPSGVDSDVEEDAEILEGGPADGAPDSGAGDGGQAPASGDAEGAEGTAPAGDAAADASGERGHGEWPAEDANRRDAERTGGRSDDWPDPGRGGAGSDPEGGVAGPEDLSPAAGESEDVEFIGGDGPDGVEDAAASEARSDVVPDANASQGSIGGPTAGEDDAEFVDSDGSAIESGGPPADDADGWPAQAGEDEGFDAEVDEAEGQVSVDGNLTPQVDGEVPEDEDAEFIEADPDAAAGVGGNAGGAGTETGSRDAGSAASDASGDAGRRGSDAGAPTDAGGRGSGGQSTGGQNTGGNGPRVELKTTTDRVETVYVCPECGAREPVGASSMRAGDICRECKRGYIEERPLE